MRGAKGTHDGKQQVADALMGVGTGHEVAALSEKEQAIKRAEAAIYSEVSKWVGSEIPTGGSVPIVRHGKHVGQLPATVLGNPARKVAEAVRVEGKREIKRKIQQYSALWEGCRDTLRAVYGANMTDRIDLEVSARILAANDAGGERAGLETRIIREIGIVEASTISLFALLEAARAQLDRLETRLEELDTGKRGPPRNEAAYAVALELARLYAKVTGRRPTYAEGPDGLSGEYTPALRKVFDELGLKVGLRGPATAARDAITEDNMKHELNRLFSLFSAMSDQ